MLSACLLCAAVGVTCWPVRVAAKRLRMLRPTVSTSRALPLGGSPGPVLVVLGAGVLGWVALGPATGIAATIAVLTAARQWRAGRRRRSAIASTEGMAQALRAMVAELRAGAHPASAAAGATQDGPPQDGSRSGAAGAAEVMATIAAAARLGGDIGPALRVGAARTPILAPVLNQLATAWSMVNRHGLPLAEVLDAVRRDLDHRVRFASQVQARMAGPRSAALILAVLPVLGVLLGELMGARPLAVLAFSPAGQALLLLGVCLTCAGVAWCGALTGRTVLR